MSSSHDFTVLLCRVLFALRDPETLTLDLLSADLIDCITQSYADVGNFCVKFELLGLFFSSCSVKAKFHYTS